MSKPKVSIVIPVYNEQKYIRNCLLSIQQQTVKPFEVIVVDNNSTDQTVDVAKEFDFVKILHEKRQGIAPTRATGCDAAKGEIIGRLDADTVLSPGWVETVSSHFNKDPELVGIGGVSGYVELSLPGKFWMKWLMDIIRRGDNKRYQTTHMYGHNMAFRRTAWNKVKKYLSYDGKDVLEDLDVSFALALEGKTAIKRDVIAKIHGLRSVDFKKYRRYSREGLLTKQKYEDLKR